MVDLRCGVWYTNEEGRVTTSDSTPLFLYSFDGILHFFDQFLEFVCVDDNLNWSLIFQHYPKT